MIKNFDQKMSDLNNHEATLKELIQSRKVINVCLESSDDIISYLEEEKSLKNSIIDLYEDFSPKDKIKIAFLHMSKEVEKYARGESLESCHDLHELFDLLFKTIYPASNSTLSLEYRNLVQGERTILEFAKRLGVLCEKIGLDLEMEKLKFISGITEEEVRETLLRADLTIYGFWGLVKYASSLVETLQLSTKFKERKEEAGMETKTKNKTQAFLVSTNYFRIAQKRGLSKGQCYNCMKGFHHAISCPQQFCSYCRGKTGNVKHFSLGCPKAKVE